MPEQLSNTVVWKKRLRIQHHKSAVVGRHSGQEHGKSHSRDNSIYAQLDGLHLEF